MKTQEMLFFILINKLLFKHSLIITLSFCYYSGFRTTIVLYLE